MQGTDRHRGVATGLRGRRAASQRGEVAFLLVAALALVGASTSTAGATGGRPVQAPTSSSGTDIGIVMSNFQFCRQAPCQWPSDAAYARGPSGPLEGTDNPNKFVAVSPGDTITWVYEDTGPGSCDALGAPPYPDDEGLVCPGHSVALENGTAEGEMVGFLTARSGRVTLTWVVPAEAKPGSAIRYFCNVRDLDAVFPGGSPHWMMTGGLKVIAARS